MSKILYIIIFNFTMVVVHFGCYRYSGEINQQLRKYNSKQKKINISRCKLYFPVNGYIWVENPEKNYDRYVYLESFLYTICNYILVIGICIFINISCFFLENWKVWCSKILLSYMIYFVVTTGVLYFINFLVYRKKNR